MVDENFLAERFQENRPRLRAVAYRMLGSLSESDDALQEAWLRASGADTDEVRNFQAWLTTIVGRVCLNMLRSRQQRKEDSLEIHIPDPVVCAEDDTNPETVALTADSVGLAMMIVLDTLAPAERFAFVLHDMFAVPFEDIAEDLEKTPAAVRQLASRARRRVEGHAPVPDPDLAVQRTAVDAFFAAARDGDFEALVAVLHPDVVLRADGGVLRASQTVMLSGARTVASQAQLARTMAPYVQRVLINGTPGAYVVKDGKPFSLMSFNVVGGKVESIQVILDPERLDAVALQLAA
ncbi:RNA polymerase, sigma-24 subunit, ECF subfamily [Catenulispora acidiphila DSM 44928]|uniref:RNA polymerase, sigma-24 subunit, ECF subfamily n=1 Tax=Catenulispora acidiphila (strain DSM 44928 / JCM 14897 / NBRC 102108 / NRRL B-24433 / ID139908) TaxID=479433 RepID=C7Q0J9_CATAD|nr:sigma-70 family RNA polymerase sigma factor [Catenulispora acidiphila]ACU77532.1 RNA polymerase, sigma-24 subunit, ECF subfamily [Catenulispora acidiphila DSM 44928]